MITKEALKDYKILKDLYRNKENVLYVDTYMDHFFYMDVTSEEELFLKLKHDAVIFDKEAISLEYFGPIEEYE